MAKTNGGTRGSNPKSMYGGSGGTAQEYPSWMSEDGWKAVVKELGEKTYPMGWDDIDPDHRELALMEAGFTGLADEGAGDIMFEVSREDAIRYAVDALDNEDYYGKPDDDVTYTIGYKDGTTKNIGGFGSDIELKGKLTKNQSSRTREGIIRRSLDVRNIVFIIQSNPSDTSYWSSDLSAIKKYTGYEKWINGRGEKRRDYIQDDWI